MPDSQTLGLIIAATVAAVLAFRLYTVLGRRTGHEPSPPETRPAPAAPELRAAPIPSNPLDRGLMDIQLADRKFDKAHFLQGARAAYEMIQKAFAAGDRLALRPPASTLAGITDARITAAGLHDDTAEITVGFRSQFAAGNAQHDVSDNWTFARRVGAADPNWLLVATSGEAA